MAKIEMALDSIRVSLQNQQRVVILKEIQGDRYLPIWLGIPEADNIAVKLQNVAVPRPLFPDFVCAIISTLGARMKEALISDLKNDCFYAKAIININKKDKEIDCRPSDALAIAVRLNTPIFADDKVLETAGIILDTETGKPLAEFMENSEGQSGVSSAAPSHLEIFSELAKNIFNQSEAESNRLNQKVVNTGHLLLALLKQPNSSIEILKNMNIDLITLLQDAESAPVEQPNVEGDGTGFTPAIKEVRRIAIAEAKCLGSAQVLPEHVLLGLLRGDDGIAAGLLKSVGITPEKIYIELIKLYTSPRS